MLDTALLQAAARVRAAPEAKAPPRPAMVSGRAAAAIAAGVAVAVALGAGGARWGQARQGAPRAAAAAKPLELATAVGVRSDYSLPDASVAHLNADTQVGVLYGEASREIDLRRGDAMFEVAKNPRRPFNVHAGDAVVTAVGTEFEVDMVADATEVRVFDGVVKATPASGPVRLVHRGEWLRLTADHLAAQGRFTPDSSRTWRADWLEAENTPLKYVVARLNRYSGDKIVVQGAGMADIGVTGRFQLSRPQDSLSMISALLGVDAVRGGGEVRLSPRTGGR